MTHYMAWRDQDKLPCQAGWRRALTKTAQIDFVETGEVSRDFGGGDTLQRFVVEVFHAARDAPANEGLKS